MSNKKCNPQPFEVRRANCPDCYRKIEPIKDGYKQCNKCMQMVHFIDWKPIKAVPKDLF